MKETDNAINKLEEIHAQLAKSGIYRGYRSVYVAVSGLIAFIATLCYPAFVEYTVSRAFVYYWVAVALINCTLAAGMIFYQYIKTETRFEKQKILKVSAQFAHMFIAGAIVTIAITYSDSSYIPLLPGIWAVLFGMGIVTMRPYLPALVILAVFYYFLAGAVLFILSRTHPGLLAQAMGAGFGLGQLISAGILYWSIERGEDETA